MQELQCVDCIVNYLENEKEANIRDYVFDLLFSDIYHQLSTKFILQLLFSYAISLEAQKTLECASKWIITNIGNEIIQNIFEQLVKDHFLLAYSPDSNLIQPNLINMCQISPLFSSLFMSIVLDMLANDLIRNQEKFLKKLSDLFEIWIEKNPMLPLLAYKSNLSHFSSYMLNPLPGLVYMTVIYPLKNFLENPNVDKEQVNEMALKIHLISLKLIKDLSSSSGSINDSFKLLNLKNLESISKRIDEFVSQAQNLNSKEKSSFTDLLNESLERLAQLLELCWQYSVICCSKSECLSLFSKLFRNDKKDDICLMEIVLST